MILKEFKITNMKYIISLLFLIMSVFVFAQTADTIALGGKQLRGYPEDRFASVTFASSIDTLVISEEVIYELPKQTNSPYIGIVAAVTDTVAGYPSVDYNYLVECSPHESDDIWVPVTDTTNVVALGTIGKFAEIPGIRTRVRFFGTTDPVLVQTVGDLKKVSTLPGIVVDDIEGF